MTTGVPNISSEHSARKAYIVTGPTSGIGYRTALELAKQGIVVLVGRDKGRLAEVQTTIEQRGQRAVSVVCDLADLASVRKASQEIIDLKLPIAGLLNNAGIRQEQPSLSAQGWDLTFATNHLGPFALTQDLAPHLLDGANVLFVASAVEDPERKPAVAAGFRGARYLSVAASARGEWAAGGSAKPGFDAYATSKQCTLAAALALARELPRLHVNAVEPGVNPTTSLGRDANPIVRVLLSLLVPLFVPFIKVLTTPQRAGRVISKLLTDTSGRTGVYFDEAGQAMQGSTAVRDVGFQDRVLVETREFLAAQPA